MEQELFGIPSTILGKEDWKELVRREDTIGPEQLLNEILSKRLWSNAEIVWVIKRMVYFYGKKDHLLKKAPADRMFMNMVDILRAFSRNGQRRSALDDNIRAYMSAR
jgi:hypothetical protein